MKKFLKFLPLALVAAIASFAFCSCGDDDDSDEPIPSDNLPIMAKSFISEYFPSAKIISAEKDNEDGYEAMLSDGTRIDFNKAGEWYDVDAAAGRAIPSGFYPSSIDDYVSDTFNGIGINEISKEKRGYNVELVTGTDMLFNYEGQFLSYDR